ncbi:MAG: OmpA family protein [Chitinophagaceae bacterium]
MKSISNPPAYSNFISTAKAFFLLLSGGIVIFVVICLMQLLAYFNSVSAKGYAEIKNPSALATTVKNIKPAEQYNNAVAKNKTDDIFTHATKPLSPQIKSVTLSKEQHDFLKQNNKKNDSIIKYLGGITEMQEFHFSKNSSRLENQNGLKKLDSITQQCINAPETWSRIVILGFTDNRGSKYNNVKLGLKRALSLKRTLVSKGLPAEKITIASFGADLPISNNKTEAGRHSNRRVEFNLIGNS